MPIRSGPERLQVWRVVGLVGRPGIFSSVQARSTDIRGHHRPALGAAPDHLEPIGLGHRIAPDVHRTAFAVGPQRRVPPDPIIGTRGTISRRGRRYRLGSVASRQGQHIRWAEERRDPAYRSGQPPVHSAPSVRSSPAAASIWSNRLSTPVVPRHSSPPSTISGSESLRIFRMSTPRHLGGPRSAVAEVQRLQRISNGRTSTAFDICRTVLARLPPCAASSEKCGDAPLQSNLARTYPTGTSLARPVRVCQNNPSCSKGRFASNPQIPRKKLYSRQEEASGQWSRTSRRLSAGTPRS